MHINFGCNFVFYIFKEIRNSLFPNKNSLAAAIHSNQPLVKGNWFLRTISVLDPKTFFSNFFKNRQINQIIKKLEDTAETANNLLTINEVLFILSLIQRKKDRSQKEEELLDLLIELNYIPSSLPLTVSSTIEPFKAQLLCARSRMEKGLNPTSISEFIAPLEKIGFSRRILCPKITEVVPQIPKPPLFLHKTTADFEKFAKSIEDLPLMTNLHKVITELPMGAPFQIGSRVFYKKTEDDELIKPMFQLSSLIVQEGGIKEISEKVKSQPYDCRNGTVSSFVG